jgi:hypothetical protein
MANAGWSQFLPTVRLTLRFTSKVTQSDDFALEKLLTVHETIAAFILIEILFRAMVTE